MIATGLLFAIVALVFLGPAEKTESSNFHELLGMKLDSDEMRVVQSLLQVYSAQL
jgi:hypothetical protein